MFFEEMMNSYWAKKAGKKKGFTLVEMLVVVAIIAALVSIVIPVFKNATVKAAAATNAANLRAAKGEFTTMKLLHPDDYSSWTGGVKALTGTKAVGQKFQVKGTELTVSAPNAVELRDGDTYIPAGTEMNAQIIKNEKGVEEVYVTYNDLPIAYFAALAETGSANASDYAGKKGSASTVAGEAWVNKLTSWGQEIADNAADQTVLGVSMYGNLISQMTDIMTDTASQGDCLECAMNNVNTDNAGILGLVAGDKVDKILANKGWEQSGYDPNNKDATESLKAYCTSYTPKDGKYGSACICSTANNTHGPEVHVSTSSSLGVGEGMEACSGGGVHDLDYNHHCSKCNKDVHVTNGKPDHDYSSSIPYMDALLQSSCVYCGQCKCCAQTGSDQEYKVFNENFSIFNATKKIKVPYGYQLAYVNYSGISAYVDGGVCMSTDPVLGGGNGKGCGHSQEAHRE